jgi:hypothetical protein
VGVVGLAVINYQLDSSLFLWLLMMGLVWSLDEPPRRGSACGFVGLEPALGAEAALGVRGA